MLGMAKEITIRQVGVISLGFTIPIDFVKSQGLQAGDIVFWSDEDGTATLKFFRVTETRTLALEAQEEAVVNTS